MNILLTSLLLLPLAGAIFQLCCGRLFPRRSLEIIACLAVGLSFLMALIAILLADGRPVTVELYQWIRVADFQAVISLYYDPVAAVMALMVTFVSTLIHLYSVAYMTEEEDYGRYFCYLNLFVFNMLVIVLAGDLLFLFVGWEGVGFCSYALIGFWYREKDNCLAGSKAFILTRIGDIALLVAIAFLFSKGFGFDLTGMADKTALLSPGEATLIGLLLLMAAAGKSAQLPLSVWLPDAMAGPTPVSALIHAATMVTAGVYLLIRLFPILALSPTAMTAVVATGTITALFGAAAALTQTDLKRLLAYSTISQVGYMVMGVGAGAIDASLFHLLCHAFYKALLFLGAGCIIMACAGEHHILRLGPGLRQRYPLLFWPFLLAVGSLAGIPPAAGFFSKGEILTALFSSSVSLRLFWWLTASGTAFLTALYSFRLLYLVFFPRDSSGTTVRNRYQPLPPAMTLTLWPLAVLAVMGGLLNLSFGAAPGWLSAFIAGTGDPARPLVENGAPHLTLAMVDCLLALAGLLTAHLLYGPGKAGRQGMAAPADSPLTLFCRDGFALDRLYGRLFARPYEAMAGFLWQSVDICLVDTLLTWPGRLFTAAGDRCRLWNTGRLTTGLHAFLLGVSLALVLVTLKIYGFW